MDQQQLTPDEWLDEMLSRMRSKGVYTFTPVTTPTSVDQAAADQLRRKQEIIDDFLARESWEGRSSNCTE